MSFIEFKIVFGFARNLKEIESFAMEVERNPG